MAFGAVLQSGAGDWVMGKLLGSKIAQKSPTMIVTFILLAGIIGNILGLSWFLYFGMFPILSQAMKKCGYEKGDKFVYFVLAGFLMAVQLGMSAFPFRGWGLMTCGSIMSMTKAPINYGTYMILMILIYALFVLSYPILMKLCGCDFTKISDLNVSEAFGVKEGGMNKKQKTFLIIIVGFCSNCDFYESAEYLCTSLKLAEYADYHFRLDDFAAGVCIGGESGWKAVVGYSGGQQRFYLGHVIFDCHSLIDF